MECFDDNEPSFFAELKEAAWNVLHENPGIDFGEWSQSLRALYTLGLVVDGANHVTPLGVQIKKMTVYRKRQKNS